MWTTNDKMATVSDDISDRDLRARLKENGISCGPITPKTKYLYIRKLRRSLNQDESSPSGGKQLSRKSQSPKQPVARRGSPGRRSVGLAPTPERKLIGFSSDEDESTSKEPVVSRQKRISSEYKVSPPKSIEPSLRQNEERPVFRRRSYNTASPTPQPRQDDDIDDSTNKNRHGFESKGGKLPSYAGLRSLFLRKSMDDSKKYANSPPFRPKISYDLEVEDEMDDNTYQYIWMIWLVAISLVMVFLLVYNWQSSGMLKNQVNVNDRKFLWNTNQLSLVCSVFVPSTVSSTFSLV